MTSATIEADPSPLTLYWMPGCSSCLRMKEFAQKQGFPHRLVNAVEEPGSAALLRGMGLAVPAAVRGGEGVPGADLVAVARLAGIDYTPPEMLAPEALRDRCLRVLDVATSLVGQLSPDQLDYQEPDRPRTLRQLALHIVMIMRGFVEIEDTNVFRQGFEHITPELDTGATRDDVLGCADETRAGLVAWWEQVGAYDTFDRVVESPGAGHWTLHEAFERAVWHTAQHVRQLHYFIGERLGLEPADALSPGDVAGLPLPESIHAGA